MFCSACKRGMHIQCVDNDPNSQVNICICHTEYNHNPSDEEFDRHVSYVREEGW